MPSGVKDIQLLELKDTISQLNKTISTQNELISSLQKMLEERNAKDSEKDLLIANLQSQLAYLKNKVFGSTSEIRHDQLDGQLNLFGTPVGDEKPAEVIEPEVISVKGYTKERKPKATYDDKYNSVRSICKHFFTDIVGLSIKFFCVSLRHMSIRRTLPAFHVHAAALSQPDGPQDKRVCLARTAGLHIPLQRSGILRPGTIQNCKIAFNQILFIMNPHLLPESDDLPDRLTVKVPFLSGLHQRAHGAVIYEGGDGHRPHQ